MNEHVGYRLERHNAHMATVRAVQRRGQLERLERVVAQIQAWQGRGFGLDGDLETIAMLKEVREDLLAEMRRNGQLP